VSLPRVLLIEDDASIGRFVAMALEELPLELVTCGTLTAARHALAGPPFALVLSDMMLPDGSGLDLLREQAGPGGLPRPPVWAAYSAGITPALRKELEALGVQYILPKPVPVAELEDCVMRALASVNDARLASEPDAPQPAPQPGSADDAAIATFFAGDRALFEAYRARCLAQFENDLQAGDAAAARGDAAKLQRLAHSLKTVLRMLGHAALADEAGKVERQATAADAAPSALWPPLRAGLAGLIGPRAQQ
jgi:CheY-like chemotaxis protein